MLCVSLTFLGLYSRGKEIDGVREFASMHDEESYALVFFFKKNFVILSGSMYKEWNAMDEI